MDVAIVSGGVTGCTAALVAARGGLRVRLHKPREISSGASGRSGGFRAARRGDALRRCPPGDLGAERAKQYWQFTERALDHLEELAGDALRRNGSLRVAIDEPEREELEREYAALREDGFAADLVDGAIPRRGLARHGRLTAARALGA